MRISLLTVVIFVVGVMAALIGLLMLRSGGTQKDHKIRKRTSLAFFLIYSSLYPLLYIVTLKVLPNLKLELSGMAGPRTSFFCEAILNPVCFLVLGIVIGRHMAIVHAVIAAVISAWIYIQYPVEPLMNFARQMAYEELPWRLLAAYGAGFMYYLVYAVVSNRSHKKTMEVASGVSRVFSRWPVRKRAGILILALFAASLTAGAETPAGDRKTDTDTSPTPAAVARALIGRIAPAAAHQFAVEMMPADNGKDVFEIESVAGRIALRGNNPVSVASAFNRYLKHYAKCHLSWCGDNLNLPDPLPPVPAKVRVVNSSRYRVYFNYCTLSYTATWWDWKRWEREIDFMAMNGINMPLGVTGIEGAWYYTLLRMGFADAEAREFLVGPAYQAWQWMPNIERYGGPLPKSWIDSHIVLGRQILDRERELGMTPIQQGFSGAVPRRLKEKFPQAAMKQQGRWCDFPGIMQLDPTDPLFAKMGGIFLDEQKRLFGTSHFYGCDPFHESGPPRSEPGYLEKVGKAIGDLLVAHDPAAVWCMQSWSLRKQILTAMPKERMLVLDIGGRWKSSDGFSGYPFVAGLIHNFGGRTRMAGDLSALSKNPFTEALNKGDNCQGMGIFPEGIEQNPVYYDLAFDLIWRNEGVKLEPWVHDYVRRRYGAESAAADKAWAILLRTVYRTVTPSSVFVTRPALDIRKCDPNNGVSMTYDPAEFFKAWELLLSDADRLKGSAAYRYDVVDLGRQALGDLAHPMHWAVANAFMDRDTNAFAQASRQFLDLFNDADAVCSTERVLSHRRWVRSAQAWATTPEERVLYTFNANMLLTHWGAEPLPDIFDYAWREWGGLLGDYYRGRWEKFHAMLSDRMGRGESWSEAGFKLNYNRPVANAKPFYNELYDWEMNWIQSDKSYAADTMGDPVEVARAMLAKYRPFAAELFSPGGRKVWAARQNRVAEDKLVKGFGQRVWAWKAGTLAGGDWQEVTFDITAQLVMGSDFELTFVREAGGELKIRSIEVDQDGVGISSDKHEGRTGISGGPRSENNVYAFHLPMVVPNAKYTVKATLRMDPGTKSVGNVWLKAKE